MLPVSNQLYSRGKKLYRRFDDELEEDEEIDAEDLGFLRQSPDGAERVRPMRTLTRKSIKPTRLFQTKEQKAAREREKEEEALTDVEEQHSTDDSTTKLAPSGRPSKAPASSSDKKKTSPFDSWPRLKKGERAIASIKTGKRTASEALGDEGDHPGHVSKVTSKRKGHAQAK